MSINFDVMAILAVGLSLASLFGFGAQKLRLPIILGYLLAGWVIGPYSPGFIANPLLAEQLAEVGVILMLFGVGLHFQVKDLEKVKNIAIPGAIIQMFSATIITIFIIYFSGWPIIMGLILGLATSVASTVVLMRQLSDHNLLNSYEGHVAIGWLIVEDIFTVFILIILPMVATIYGGENLSPIFVAGTLFWSAVKFLLLALFMFTWGDRIVGYILMKIARLHTQELFTLTVMATVFLIAACSAELFGTSIALGAFIAGMVIGRTTVKHQAAVHSLPLKDMFVILFFLSVGMIFNPMSPLINWHLFISLMAVIMLAKPFFALLTCLLLKAPLRTLLTVSIGLTQIGEFSFILSEEALRLGLLSAEGFDVLVACAIVSIALNPLIFKTIAPLEALLQKRLVTSSKMRTLIGRARRASSAEAKLPKIVIVGYGSLGRGLCEQLKELKLNMNIIENNIDKIIEEGARKVIYGDGGDEDLLRNAHIAEAHYLFITVADSVRALAIIETARRCNPEVEIVTLMERLSEKMDFDMEGVTAICIESSAHKAFLQRVKSLFR